MVRLVSISEEKMIVNNEPEMRGLKCMFGLYAFFILASIIMPQYFGLHIGYDITCSRLANMLFIGYMMMCPAVMNHFIHTIVRCEIFYPLCLYLIVAGYTMVLRADLNAFFLVFFEIFSLFMMIYGIRYVVGYRRAIKWVIGCAYFLGIYGLVEFVYGKSIFLKFFKTVPTTVVNSYRSGQYRIMGPCGHSLGFGLILLLFIALACLDFEKNELYLFKRPLLLLTLLANVFLTGSRSALGYAVLEVVLILAFSNRDNLKKSLFYLMAIVVIAICLLLIFYKTSIGQYLLGQIFSVIDEVLGTSYAANFGVEVERLQDSTEYRKVLPLIFTLDWLNPLVGRGRDFGGAEINGMFIQSIDNYYVSQYIKYAYPGMISYILFLCVLLFVCIKVLRKREVKNSAVVKAVFIACVLYFWNLWWVDSLQTLKYIYLVIAIFYGAYLECMDNINIGVNRRETGNE